MISYIARSVVNFYREVQSPKGVAKTVNGIPCRFTARYAKGVPSTIKIPMLELFLREATKASVVLELGGHIGTWSELIANVMPTNGKLFVFEPHPGNFSILKKQRKVSLSSEKIFLINKAVGESYGFLNFDARTTMKKSLDESAKSKLLMSNSETIHGKTMQVEVITTDDFCEQNNLYPDLIKVDIEGAELLALKGMRRMLSQGKAKIIIEMHQFAFESFGYSANDFLQFTKEFSHYELRDNNGNLIEQASGAWLDNKNVGFVTLMPKNS